MPTWSPQHYRFVGEQQGVDSDVLDAASKILEQIRAVDARLPPILTLRHLSELTETPWYYLDKVVSRQGSRYKRVLLRKKVPGRSRFREIHIPEQPLLRVQRWVARNILRNTSAHSTSYAYHPNSQAVFAAKQHCSCKWLLKIDIEDFFHSISEGQVFLTYKSLGYPSLLAFELARISTFLPSSGGFSVPSPRDRWTKIGRYRNDEEGRLPQGAPTSPMLSNLVMRYTDEKLASLANERKFVYTRYSDDLAFSTPAPQTLRSMKQLKNKVCAVLSRAGFRTNRRKTVIRGPGARRIVLGMLVDSDKPRLPKEFKQNIRRHLYYLNSPSHGPSQHANSANTSVSTLYHHIRGKIEWAKRVEPTYGANCLGEFNKVEWPPIDAVSTGRCNTFTKLLGRRIEL